MVSLWTRLRPNLENFWQIKEIKLSSIFLFYWRLISWLLEKLLIMIWSHWHILMFFGWVMKTFFKQLNKVILTLSTSLVLFTNIHQLEINGNSCPVKIVCLRTKVWTKKYKWKKRKRKMTINNNSISIQSFNAQEFITYHWKV